MIFRSLSLVAIFGIVSAQDLKLVTNSTDNIYLESKNKTDVVGYNFSLFQNVLTILINASTIDSVVKPTTYAILPNLILEYNSNFSIDDTSGFNGFLNKNNNSSDWGNGLLVAKHEKDVYEINGNWTESNKLRFKAKMFVASKATTYKNMKLHPNEITMFFSILEYPYKLNESILAFDQILLSGVGVKNSSAEQAIQGALSSLATLSINGTALVDGEPQLINGGTLDEKNLEIIAGNATKLNVTELSSEDLLLTFTNSSRAKNVTFEQRLVLNTSAIYGQIDRTENAGYVKGVPSWFGGIIMISCLFVALPIMFL